MMAQIFVEMGTSEVFPQDTTFGTCSYDEDESSPTYGNLTCTGMPGTDQINSLMAATQEATAPSGGGTISLIVGSVFETVKAMGFYLIFAFKAVIFLHTNLITLGVPSIFATPLSGIVYLSFIVSFVQLFTGRRVD